MDRFSDMAERVARTVTAGPMADASSAAAAIVDGMEGVVSEQGEGALWGFWRNDVLDRFYKMGPKSTAGDATEILEDLVDGLEGMVSEEGEVPRRYWKPDALRKGKEALKALKTMAGVVRAGDSAGEWKLDELVQSEQEQGGVPVLGFGYVETDWSGREEAGGGVERPFEEMIVGRFEQIASRVAKDRTAGRYYLFSRYDNGRVYYVKNSPKKESGEELAAECESQKTAEFLAKAAAAFDRGTYLEYGKTGLGLTGR